MANLNDLVISSQYYSIVLKVPTATVPITYNLLTVNSLDFNDASENEDIYAIGQEDPIGNKSNANSYRVKLVLQIGELNAILALAGFNSAIRIRNATLSIAAIQGGFSKVYKSVNINTDTSSVRAKDKETLTTLDGSAIGLL